jgi:hypothetical protein
VPVRESWIAGLDLEDQELIEEAISLVRDTDTDTVLTDLPLQLTTEQRASIAAHSAFSHAAVLVSPASIGELVAGLRARGLLADEPVPSVVVRDRLSVRHGLPVSALNVAIVHVHIPVPGSSARLVELFALEVPPGSGLAGVAVRERRERNESHLALEVDSPDEVVVAGLCALLAGQGGMAADGGGYNHVEDRTVLYFRPAAGSSGDSGHMRLELRVRGHCAAALAAHRRDAGNVGHADHDVSASR